ncbi:serine/threonine-protein phosphatase 4 regulatory subunit 1-like [Pocillopora damicornis]|uniref:serine/threonine-protein phosphatase 4 regulatory subunit 1-like n=1 Tax=Pocillopora damicornis TaxID=46731 RepID=UPI000F54EC69|nr:serine/threonine-protein phosphatase 4 regulatory subunit 1-like [Pocillopora damicornis]
MADIQFHIENTDGPEEEDQEDEGYEMDQDETSLHCYASAEEPMSPLNRMERFMLSDIIVNRQMAARCCQDALRASKAKEEVYHVLRLMVRLSDDIEPSVRVELMEQVPHVAVYCYEHHSMMEAVPQYILFIVLRFLTDSNNQVRKTSQAALLVLLEQEVVEREDVEEQVCPVLLQLTAGESNDDFRSEAVALMSKMAPLVGRDITERYFLPRFELLCSDPLFHVRKVCASNFGEMCSVLGPEVTNEKMLPVFFKLCQDGVWGVRKACAECYMSVSSASPAETRKRELSQFFVSLLCDKSRWVQMAAYQSLGPFISTFADPADSGFYINEDGILTALPERELETPPPSPTKTEGEPTSSETTSGELNEDATLLGESQEVNRHQTERQASPEAGTTDSGYISPPEIISNDQDLQKQSHAAQNKDVVAQTCSKELRNCDKHMTTDLDEVDDKYFDSFLYWRTPLPQVELDADDVDVGTVENVKSASDKLDLKPGTNALHEGETSGLLETQHRSNAFNQHHHRHPKLAFMHGDDDSDEEDGIPLYSLTDDFHMDHGLGKFDYDDYRKLNLTHTSSFDDDLLIADHITAPPVQHVIPQTLLDHYISMTEPAKAQTIDTEIVRHCAFSLPAVTLTLGRKNWPCLRDTFEMLIADMQWKVRRTLAFSIHELALVLGSEITRIELVPTFNSFLKDLDEVRIGVLKHLADFIKLLPSDVSGDYLPMLTDFLTTDNNRNWRFRFELAEQLMSLCEIYEPKQVLQYICPIAISLATDRVADVRTIAFKLIGILLQRLHSCTEDGPAHKFVCDIINKFAHSPQWTRRQAYAQLCQNLLEENVETGEQFSQEFLPSLLYLLTDPVPNVRLSLARTLSQSVTVLELFKENDAEGKEAILSALQRLQYDPDRDVRYFAGVEEDALDLTYEGQMTSLDSAQDDLQEVSYALEEDCELENLIPNDEGESRANEVVTINEENKTETFNNTELLEDFHQTTLEESSSSATVFGTNLESTAFEFEEDERRLDLQSQDLTNTGNTSEELDKDVKCGEEREPQCSIEELIDSSDPTEEAEGKGL